jgi:hypothetical protein
MKLDQRIAQASSNLELKKPKIDDPNPLNSLSFSPPCSLPHNYRNDLALAAICLLHPSLHYKCINNGTLINAFLFISSSIAQLSLSL